jgi:hypothetical protein
VQFGLKALGEAWRRAPFRSVKPRSPQDFLDECVKGAGGRSSGPVRRLETHSPFQSRGADGRVDARGDSLQSKSQRPCWPFLRRVCQQPSSRMLKLPRLKNCLVYGRAKHKRLVENMSAALEPNSCARQIIRVFLCGDVMTGRGIDQIMPHPCDPQLYEDWVQLSWPQSSPSTRTCGIADPR